jgi:hypothetical protein
MMRALAALVAVLMLGACSSPSGGGGGGGGDAVLPPGGVVWFGSAYEQGSLGITGRHTSSVKAGTPIVAVARFHNPRNPADVRLSVTSGANAHNNVAITATNSPDAATIYVADLTGLALGPSTWQVNFTDPQSRIIAAGFIQVTP